MAAAAVPGCGEASAVAGRDAAATHTHCECSAVLLAHQLVYMHAKRAIIECDTTGYIYGGGDEASVMVEGSELYTPYRF